MNSPKIDEVVSVTADEKVVTDAIVKEEASRKPDVKLTVKMVPFTSPNGDILMRTQDNKTYPNYAAEMNGSVVNTRNNKILKVTTDQWNQKRVGVRDANNKPKTIRVDRFVWECFSESMVDDGMEVYHLDGNNGNCAANNLGVRSKQPKKIAPRGSRVSVPLRNPRRRREFQLFEDGDNATGETQMAVKKSNSRKISSTDEPLEIEIREEGGEFHTL